MRQYGWDAKLTDLLSELVADCLRGARSVSMTGVQRRCSRGGDEAGHIRPKGGRAVGEPLRRNPPAQAERIEAGGRNDLARIGQAGSHRR